MSERRDEHRRAEPAWSHASPGSARAFAASATVVLALVASMVLSPDLHAQAGGGGSYGTGGDGSAEFLFWLFYTLLQLCIDAPIIGIPLTIGTMIVVVVGIGAGWDKQKSWTIRRARPARRAQLSHYSCAALVARDENFDERKFLARVSGAFRRTQEAWSRQDLSSVQSFLSDGVLERFGLQIEEQVRDGIRQEVEGLRLDPLSIVHVGSDPHFDTVTVQISFRANVYSVRRDTGEKVQGSELPFDEFNECWSFLRRQGVRSVTGEGLFEGNCPNCGASLAMNQSARCASCQSKIKSGEYDWVLAEITQVEEWRQEDTGAVPGLLEYQKTDPGMNVQHLEDLASVMFWREAASDRDGHPKALKNVATPALIEELASDESRTYVGDRAVGSVKTLGILKGAEFDRAVVEIRWDGCRYERRDGESGVKTGDRSLRRTLLELRRRVNAKTDLGQTLTSAHCAGCGAPEDGGSRSSCTYCGAPRQSSEDWLLARLAPASSPAGRNLFAAIDELVGPTPATAPSRAAMLNWTIRMAKSDGVIDASETRQLRDLAKKCEMPPERLDLLLQSVNGDGVALPPPTEPTEARRWMREMVRIGLADGRVSRAERRILRSAAAHAGYSTHDTDQLIRRTHTELYRESRAALRAEKRARTQ